MARRGHFQFPTMRKSKNKNRAQLFTPRTPNHTIPAIAGYQVEPACWAKPLFTEAFRHGGDRRGGNSGGSSGGRGRGSSGRGSSGSGKNGSRTGRRRRSGSGSGSGGESGSGNGSRSAKESGSGSENGNGRGSGSERSSSGSSYCSGTASYSCWPCSTPASFWKPRQGPP